MINANHLHVILVPYFEPDHDFVKDKIVVWGWGDNPKQSTEWFLNLPNGDKLLAIKSAQKEFEYAEQHYSTMGQTACDVALFNGRLNIDAGDPIYKRNHPQDVRNLTLVGLVYKGDAWLVHEAHLDEETRPIMGDLMQDTPLIYLEGQIGDQIPSRKK